MSSGVAHRGEVVACDENLAMIRIENSDSCSGCHVKDYCGQRDQELIRVEHSDLLVGDQVDLRLDPFKGYRAVIVAYVIPFLLIAMVIILSVKSGASETLVAFFSLLAIPAYYGLLYLLRDYLSQSFDLKVDKHE